MTKLAILSDIHGNLPALEAVFSDLKKFDIDHVIVPGDVINFGPFSRQTAEFVIEKGWSTIRGNNEYFLVDYKRRVPWRNGMILSNLHPSPGWTDNSISGSGP